MDRESAKNILSAYRPSGADALDKTFRSAIEFAERDPETSAWWKQQSAFDQAAAAAMETLPRDPEGRERIEAMLELETAAPRAKRITRLWRGGIGLAAVLLAGIALYPVLQPTLPQHAGTPLRTETFSMAALADQALPVDHRAETPAELTSWLASRGAAHPTDLPGSLADTPTRGCRILPVEGTGAVSLLCFEKDGELIHLFVFEGSARSLLATVPTEWTTEGGWHFRQLDSDDRQGLAVATRADPKWVDRML